VIVHPDMLTRVPAGTVPIVTTEPYDGWARVVALFYPAPCPRPGAHPTAFVSERAFVGPSAGVGPFALVAAGAEVGARCWVGPHVTIAEGIVLRPDVGSARMSA
jgi:UDP-3-O-[3-hydroxymyristoyl] glucosamine N-acyltransferase